MGRYERSARERRSPSFSSTLLDSIYRSIDGERDDVRGEVLLHRETTRKKQSAGSCKLQKHGEEEEIRQMRCPRRFSHRVDQLAEERRLSERARRAPDLEVGFGRSNRGRSSTIYNCSTSSSYSSGGDFSSSEADSVRYGSGSAPCSLQRLHRSEKPPPLTKKKTHFPEIFIPSYRPETTKKEGFIKSKSKAASKICDELRKAKPPNSPTVRIASFINSLFAARNMKKAKVASASPAPMGDLPLGARKPPKSAQTPTCSSASSFSRSCLNKNPSSASGKIGDGVKRSVSFYPVSIIFDEDCRPCGQKHLHGGDTDLKLGNFPPAISSSIGKELKFQLTEKNQRVEEAAKDLLKGYRKKSELLGDVLRDLVEDEEEDDAASCSSSDLFELENLTSFDIERYREELPVYETTHLRTNRAIANGLIL